MLFLLVLSSCA